MSLEIETADGMSSNSPNEWPRKWRERSPSRCSAPRAAVASRSSLARGWNDPPVVHDASLSSHRGRCCDTRDRAADSRCGTIFKLLRAESLQSTDWLLHDHS